MNLQQAISLNNALAIADFFWDGNQEHFKATVDLIKLRQDYKVEFPSTWIDVHGRRVYRINLCSPGGKIQRAMIGNDVGKLLADALMDCA
jgi:hypothetical protein